jgi:hypothetical protein
LRYYNHEKGKFVTTEDNTNLDKAEKLRLMEQMMELRLQKKFEYLNDEALMRLERKNKIEIFKQNNIEGQEEIERKKRENKVGPGVWSYEPDYYPWGNTNPSYSISGRIGKGFLDGARKSNHDNMMSFEGNAKIIANSLQNGKIPLPNYNAISNSPPKYSFSKEQHRFNLPMISKNDKPGPGSYSKNDFVTINKNKDKVL